MTETLGCDFAFSHPDPGGLYAAGYRFALRYIGPGSSSKRMNSAERQNLHSAGLGVGLAVEGAAGDIFRGAGVGHAHAALAKADEVALGAPPGVRKWFAADQNVNSSNIAAAVDYFRGVGAVYPVPEIGVYGDTDILAALHDQHLASGFWKTAADSWDGKPIPPYLTMDQRHNGVPAAGGIVDQDYALIPDWGQWKAGDMPLTAQEIAAIANASADRVWHSDVDSGDRDISAGTALLDVYDRKVSPVDVAALAAAVATALAADQTFLTSLATAVNDDAAARLAK